MGDNQKPSAGAPRPPAPSTDAELRARVIEQTPTVFLTLLSVLVGLVLSDLAGEARAHIRLWPLDFMALRSWGQLTANGGCALGVWVVLAHLGAARRRVPHMIESLSAFGPPVMLLAAATFVGRTEFWPWLYFAGLYLVACLVTVQLNVRLTMDQPGGSRFARLLNPLGCLSVLYLGAPFYLVAGFLDQRGWLSPPLEVALAFAPTPANLLTMWLFFRDWRAALEDD